MRDPDLEEMEAAFLTVTTDEESELVLEDFLRCDRAGPVECSIVCSWLKLLPLDPNYHTVTEYSSKATQLKLAVADVHNCSVSILFTCHGRIFL